MVKKLLSAFTTLLLLLRDGISDQRVYFSFPLYTCFCIMEFTTNSDSASCLEIWDSRLCLLDSATQGVQLGYAIKTRSYTCYLLADIFSLVVFICSVRQESPQYSPLHLYGVLWFLVCYIAGVHLRLVVFIWPAFLYVRLPSPCCRWGSGFRVLHQGSLDTSNQDLLHFSI